MAKLDQYSEEQWDVISSLPQLVGGMIAGADSSGLVGSTKEIFETAKSYLGGKEKFPTNTLIQAIVPNTKDSKAAIDDVKGDRKRLIAHIKGYGVKSQEELAVKILEDCSKTMAILKEKESEETVTEYKTWLLDIAENVANAGTEGDFLGFGGVKFSDKEKVVFNTLKETLK